MLAKVSVSQLCTITIRSNTFVQFTGILGTILNSIYFPLMSPTITQDIPLLRMHNKFSDIFEYDLFVRCGAEIWTVFGENGKSEFHCSGTVFRF